MKRLIASSVAVIAILGGLFAGCLQAERHGNGETVKVQVDTIKANKPDPDRYSHLTDDDFRKVAKELGVEVAAIKAVVSIEAGSAMKGFWAPGIPVINFDATMYRRFAAKAASKAGAKGESVPASLTGYARKEWTELINARKVNAQGANMGTFWGMFQIGGFNYKICGCESVDEFVRLMSYSELEQLELFAAFIENSGFVKDLRLKNWSAFARKYNGPSYAKRGYHTKMANAYAKFKAQEGKSAPEVKGGDARTSGRSLSLPKSAAEE